MANTTKNKNDNKKRKGTKNSTRKSSSDQKENRPKNKVTKPNPNDCIAMSKQLLRKKNNNHAKRRTSSRNEKRICGNGKPLPSLADLEKMFEDSDEDENAPKSPLVSTQREQSRTTPTPEKPIVIGENTLLSPKTIAKISEKVIDLISNITDPSELLDAVPPPPVIPQKKRKKSDVPYIVGCKDRPKVPSRPSTNFCKGDDNYGVDASCADPEDSPPKKRAKKSRIQAYTKSIFNAKSDEIAEKLTSGCLSDESSDSNKTVEYNPMAFQNYRPRTFSPLPSTSRDNETFMKNDELFNKSLSDSFFNDNILNNGNETLEEDSVTSGSLIKIENLRRNSVNGVTNTENLRRDSVTNDVIKSESETLRRNSITFDVVKNENENSSENMKNNEELTDTKNDNDLQIIDIPYETIVIDDSLHVDKPIKFKDTSDVIDTNDIEIVESTEIDNVNKAKRRKHNDDDDCILISDATERKIENPNEPIVIDDEYSNINLINDLSDTEPIEIIDIDDVIAENKSIIDKWKNYGTKELDKINIVVDVPTTYRNTGTLQPNTNSKLVLNTDSLMPQTNNIDAPSTNNNLIPSITDTTSHSSNLSMSQADTIPNISYITNSASTNSTPPTNLSSSNITSAAQTSCNNLITSPSNLSSIFDLDSNSIISSSNAPNTAISGNVVNLTNRNNETNYVGWRPIHPRLQGRNHEVDLHPLSRIDTSVTIDQLIEHLTSTINRQTNARKSTSRSPRKTNTTPASSSVYQTYNPSPPIAVETLTYNTSPANTSEKQSNNPSPATSVEKQSNNQSLGSPGEKQTPTRNIGECPICMDPLSNSGIASTLCGHVFCLKCIQTAIKANGKRCPTCRKVLKGAGGGYHQLYL